MRYFSFYFKNLFYRLFLISAAFIMLFTQKSYAQENYYFPSNDKNKYPFTNLKFNDDSSKVQFAIVSDLWGGYRPGIFEDAVSKLQLLQPQFVMSVGDLIDGKTYDSTIVSKEWEEFKGMLQPLTMPFFYVPGNHDISNPMMERMWQERFGNPYYYFIYKNVLFLCVDTQDEGYPRISDKQIEYFKKAILDHPNVRWTFIFMHRPVWQDEDQEGFEKIQAFLNGRNYTVFSGHSHHYVYVNRNGIQYFTLATTGGKSFLYGPKYGWFDQIAWVTLDKNHDPQIINIELNGLLKKDFVNEKVNPIDSMLVYQKWLITPSYVAEKQLEESINPRIIFSNSTNFPLKVSGNLSHDERYQITPEKISLTIQPHSKETRELTVRSKNGSTLDLSKQKTINFMLNGTVKYDTVRYELPATKQMLLSWKYVLPQLSNAGEISETNFVNGDTTGFVAIRNPEYLEDHWYWSGPEDCLIRFKLLHDKRYIYLLAFITDDQLVKDHQNNGDLLYVHLEDKRGNPVYFTIDPFDKRPVISATGKGNISVKDLQVKSIVKDDGLSQSNGLIRIRLRIPVDDVVKPDHSFRFNIGYHDQDDHPESHSSTIFWKPKWGSETDYMNSGTFILEKKD